tara:strand:- start:1478 stop:1726 length:249 start_codon:yes stop_codon:yes gene_type:complete
MPKYKNITEGIVDRFIHAVFKKAAGGLESATINKLKKSDPELAKEFQKLKDARARIQKQISKKSKKQFADKQIPDVIKQYLK